MITQTQILFLTVTSNSYDQKNRISAHEVIKYSAIESIGDDLDSHREAIESSF